MSLDVYLTQDDKEVYWSNITHNLGRMANEAGIYQALWRPEEIGITKASQLVGPLSEGLLKLVGEPGRFEALNASNGWGKWENFVPFVAKYLEACKNNPDAAVRVSR